MAPRRRIHQRERGAGAILVLGICLVCATVFLGALSLGQTVGARQDAQDAADCAALAGARLVQKHGREAGLEAVSLAPAELLGEENSTHPTTVRCRTESLPAAWRVVCDASIELEVSRVIDRDGRVTVTARSAAELPYLDYRCSGSGGLSCPWGGSADRPLGARFVCFEAEDETCVMGFTGSEPHYGAGQTVVPPGANGSVSAFDPPFRPHPDATGPPTPVYWTKVLANPGHVSYRSILGDDNMTVINEGTGPEFSGVGAQFLQLSLPPDYVVTTDEMRCSGGSCDPPKTLPHDARLDRHLVLMNLTTHFNQGGHTYEGECESEPSESTCRMEAKSASLPEPPAPPGLSEAVAHIVLIQWSSQPKLVE